MRKIMIGALLALSAIVYGKQEDGGMLHKAATVVSNGVDSGKKAVTDAANTIDTSSNFRRMYADMKGGIAALASSLKVGAEHVYIILVRQQVVYAVTHLLVSLLIFCIPLFYWKRMTAWAKETDADGAEWLAWTASTVLPAVVGLVTFICYSDGIVTGICNPEYGAIQDIIKMVHP